MLRIDRLGLSFPPGFELRAQAVVQLLGEQLAALHLSTSGSIERLQLPPVQVDPAHGNTAIAAQIARAIAREIESAPSGGTGSGLSTRRPTR